MESRNLPLDGLRGLGALIVLFWHVAVLYFPTAAWGKPISTAAWWEALFHSSPAWILVSGGFAVELFFVISGYVLTVGYFRSKDLPAVCRRVIGRWPRLALPASVASLSFVTLWYLSTTPPTDLLWHVAVGTGAIADYPEVIFYPRDYGVVGVFRNVFWTPWFTVPDFISLYDNVLWTMYVELSGSLGAMFLAVVLGAATSKRVAAAGIMIAAAITLFAAPSGYGVYFSLFLTGTAIAAYDPIVSERPHRWHTVALVALFGVGVVMGGYNGAGLSRLLSPLELSSNVIPGAVLIKGVGAAFVFLAVMNSRLIADWFASRPLVWLGRVSFSLYLFHTLVIWVVGVNLYMWLPPDLTVTSRATLASAAVILVSLAVARLATIIVDEPAIRLSKSIGRLFVATPTPKAAAETLQLAVIPTPSLT